MRVVVLCDGKLLPVWQASCIEYLASVPGIDLHLLPIPSRLPRASRARGLWRALYQSYVRPRSRAEHPIRIGDVVERCPCIPRVWDPSEDAALSSLLSALDTDVILRLVPAREDTELAAMATHGVWSFDHVDAEAMGCPASFWEFLYGSSVATSALWQTGREARLRLHEGAFPLVSHSYARSRDALYLGAAIWPSRVCRQLLAGARPEGEWERADPMRQREPSTVQILALVARSAGRFFTRQWRQVLLQPQWSIGIFDGPIENLLDDPVPSIRWLIDPPRHQYFADPFGRTGTDGTLTVLAERVDVRSPQGQIVALEGTRKGGLKTAVEAIKLDVHSSYPFLFEHANELYCIPETRRLGEVRLYRAVDFPRVWELHAVLLRGVEVSDPTIVHFADRWWLFGSEPEPVPHTHLNVWQASRLEGPWQAHAANPVKSDPRSSRPAGTPFVLDGTLFRPAQDCSIIYGGRVVINRVRTLTATAFEEEPCAVVSPDPRGSYPVGLHTLATVDERLTLVDGLRHVVSWTGTRRALRARLAVLGGRRER